ncbi:MAG: glycosyl hydrolase 2 galactose-binding domain-containing protein [Fimbriimonadaceae bacterium]
MNSTNLDKNWKFCLADENPGYHRPQTQDMGWLEAEVPGYIHTDLMRHGVIGDPFVEKQELGCRWVDERAWNYECTFDWSPKDGLPNRVLVFEGLDTVVDVYLNEKLIGSFDNMFMRQEIDVAKLLIDGENCLRLCFHSAVRVGDERRATYFAENGIRTETAWFDERAFVRKAGCMSGWDWGPRLVSCGIWKPIKLVEFESRIRTSSVGQEFLGHGRFRVSIDVDIEGAGEPEFFWNQSQVGQSFVTSDQMWWPVHEGVPALHELEIRLGDQVVRKQVGLRTIELIREPDEVGTSFEFLVNGRRVWCRGANWIPHDSFLTRVRRDDVFAAIDRYRKLGMNMLRVWGGGVYESDDFYDACDEAGILVWQDFPYACSYYPDNAEFKQVAFDEAVHQISRLKDRACLAIWCGNNENRALWQGKWGVADASPDRFYGEIIYDEVLKRAVAENDPGRPYIESSPLLVQGMVDEAHAPAQRHSDDHFWDVWHGRGDWCFYRDSETRFSSEFGFASSCSLEAWKMVSGRELSPTDPAVRWHDKTNKPWDVFKRMVEIHYPESETIEDWVYYSQLNQRDAMRAALEHYRSNAACRGALIWQANDIWPVQSWALEDSACLVKPAGFEMRRCFAPVMLAATMLDKCLNIVVCNDSQEGVSGSLIVRWLDCNGGVLLESSDPFRTEVDGRQSQCFDLIIGAKFAEVLVAGRTDLSRFVNLVEPKHLEMSPQILSADRCGDELILTCPGFVFDLAVWDEMDANRFIDAETGIAGCRIWTGTDLKIKFKCPRDLKSLRARSIAGNHDIKNHE